MPQKIVCLSILASFLICSCKNDAVPKPSGQLRLDYPVAGYASFENACPYSFSINADAVITEKSPCNFIITYPKMKATIHLSYKKVEGNIDHLLRDAQKLTYRHVIKADDIVEQPYLNNESKVYGMFYQVQGDAATNAQFYVTDSTRHFVAGSVYFYTKPNFDSILPAASYLKNDMRTIMETMQWK